MPDLDLSDYDLSEKEEKILISSIKLFSEKGFNSSTTKEIASNAGIGEGTIFKYYKNKKDILTGILKQFIRIISDKIIIPPIKNILIDKKINNLKSTLKEIIFDRMYLVDKIFPMVKIIFIEMLYHENIRKIIFEEIIEKAVKVFKDFYQINKEKFNLRTDINPECIFRSIIGNIFIFIAQKKLFGDYFNNNDKKDFDELIDIIINGITYKRNKK